MEFKAGDLALLSTKKLKWHIKGKRAEKLMEQFIGPYSISDRLRATVVPRKGLVQIKDWGDCHS